jgi:hypothetical protein
VARADALGAVAREVPLGVGEPVDGAGTQADDARRTVMMSPKVRTRRLVSAARSREEHGDTN